MAGTMASFAVYAGAIIWVFTIRQPAIAWLGLISVSLLLGTSGILLGSTGI